MKKIVSMALALLAAASLICSGNKAVEAMENTAAGSGSVPDLTGQWKQVNSAYEDAYQGAVIDGETIEIYWVTDGGHSRSLYWAGPFVQPEAETWSLRNDKSKTDGEPLASHDDAKEFHYADGQIRYIASLTGADMAVQLERADWVPAEEEKAGGTAPEDRTESGFDPETNRVLSLGGVKFFLPAYFDVLTGDSSDTDMMYSLTDSKGHGWLAFVAYDWTGVTQKEFEEVKSTLTFDQNEELKDDLSDIKTGDITIAGLSGWSMSCRDRAGTERPSTDRQCAVFNSRTGTLFFITMDFYDDDRTAYDYAGDFQKMLDSAELTS